MDTTDGRSEITPEGKREVKLDQVLLNGNNVCMVRGQPLRSDGRLTVNAVALLTALDHSVVLDQLIPGGFPTTE